MSEAETDLLKILSGETPGPFVCDVDPIGADSDKEHVIAKKTAGWIVCGVLLNDQGQVLMMQEAKRSCRGTWYLPAGRIEPNETFQEAVCREVEEETGLTFEPSTLLMAEVNGGHWVRLTFTGTVTGGKLKTPAEADGESLQACWCSVQDVRTESDMPIRAKDIFPIIDLAVQHQSTPESQKPPCVLPVLQAHKFVSLRLVLLKGCSEGNVPELLVRTTPTPHLPTTRMLLKDWSIILPLLRLLRTALVLTGDALSGKLPIQLAGVLGVEHLGKPHGLADGICLTLLYTLAIGEDTPTETTHEYSWCPVTNEELRARLIDTCENNKCIKFKVH
ncbi:8-oxo-dGDP phosphatase NUDT18-like [Branchiostoma floridae x Branchiostoma belcheri]